MKTTGVTEPFAASGGWAALAKDVKRLMREARRRHREGIRINQIYLEGRGAGEIAALVKVRESIARCGKAQPNAQALPQGGAKKGNDEH